jgi:hypothetical protein
LNGEFKNEILRNIISPQATPLDLTRSTDSLLTWTSEPALPLIVFALSVWPAEYQYCTFVKLHEGERVEEVW